MNVKSFTVEPYSRRLKMPLVTSYGSITARDGFYITLTTDDGISGYSEVAPLPSYLPVSMEEVYSGLKGLEPKLDGLQVSADKDTIHTLVEELVEDNPYVASGLEFALCDAASKESKLALSKWLNKDAKSSVPVNYLIQRPVADWEALSAEIKLKGYRAVKIKVGAEDISKDVDCVMQARDYLGPDIALRLDANRGWDFKTACECLLQIKHVNIEYIEEPILGSGKELRALREETGTAVALDESLDTYGDVIAAAKEGYCDVIIVKPLLLSGAINTILAFEAITSCGKRAVMTSMLETETGIASLLHLAAALPGDLPPAGLDTLSLFEEYTKSLSLVSKGVVGLPKGTGIGYERSNSRSG